MSLSGLRQATKCEDMRKDLQIVKTSFCKNICHKLAINIMYTCDRGYSQPFQHRETNTDLPLSTEQVVIPQLVLQYIDINKCFFSNVFSTKLST